MKPLDRYAFRLEQAGLSKDEAMEVALEETITGAIGKVRGLRALSLLHSRAFVHTALAR